MTSPRSNAAAGFTMAELVTTLAIAMLVVTATSIYSLPWLARERMRSSVHEVQTAMQLARVRAIGLNRDCRLLIDSELRTLTVLDGMGTSTQSDDQSLHVVRLPGSVSFAQPDGGAPITLTPQGGSSYQAVFGEDGVVDSGTGAVVLFGGESYGRVSLYGAGGIRVESWDGSGWKAGL